MDIATTISTFRTAMLERANAKYASDPLSLPLAVGAIDLYCKAWHAYAKTVGNTVTSYSINGRSVTKVSADSTQMLHTYRRLRKFFPELPDTSVAGSSSFSIDFSEVL